MEAARDTLPDGEWDLAYQTGRRVPLARALIEVRPGPGPLLAAAAPGPAVRRRVRQEPEPGTRYGARHWHERRGSGGVPPGRAGSALLAEPFVVLRRDEHTKRVRVVTVMLGHAPHRLGGLESV
jgi:hypothetical protein